MLSSIKNFCSKYPLIILGIMLWVGVIYANLTSHTEALIDTFILSLDSNADGALDVDSVPTTSVYFGTTSLEETTAADDSGAYIIGTYDEFDNSSSTNIQDILDDFDAILTACLKSNSNFTAGAYTYDFTSATSLSFPAYSTGTISAADEATLSQGGTTAGDWYTVFTAYDEGITTHTSFGRPYAHATNPYFELGPTTNNIKIDSDGAVTLQGTAVQISGPATNIKSGAYTVGTDDPRECYGGIIYVTSATTITACDGLDDNMGFTIITIGAIAVSADVQSDDLMYLDGTALDDGDKATNTSTTGDMIVFSYYSASGWYAASGSPDGDHWTDGGP